MLSTVLGSIGVPVRYRDKDFPGWYNFENDIGAAWRDGDNPQTLILTGDVGTGKTGILCASLRAAVANQLLNGTTIQAEWGKIADTFLFVHYRDLTKIIRRFDNPDDQADARDQFETWCKLPLLVIDDLMDGVVRDWDLVKLGELIDRRYNSELPIWLSTNYSYNDLKAWPGFERSYSRLWEMAQGVVYELSGTDRRIKP